MERSQPPPTDKPHTTYVLLAGLPGTGKSTLANALAARLQSSVILNKDTIRQALFPGKATDYSEAQNDLCMQALMTAAAYLSQAVDPPRYIFFDGRTFSCAAHVDQVIHCAEASNAAWSVLYLWCEDEVAFSRLKSASNKHPAKNRDSALYVSLKQSFEPIRQPHLSIDSGQPLQNSVAACLAHLESKVE